MLHIAVLSDEFEFNKGILSSVIVLETMFLVLSGLEAKSAGLGLGLERFDLDNNTDFKKIVISPTALLI